MPSKFLQSGSVVMRLKRKDADPNYMCPQTWGDISGADIIINNQDVPLDMHGRTKEEVYELMQKRIRSGICQKAKEDKS